MDLVMGKRIITIIVWLHNAHAPKTRYGYMYTAKKISLLWLSQLQLNDTVSLPH